MSKSEGGVLPVFSPASGTASTAPMAEQRTRPLRHEVGVCLGEFIGTFMFLFLAFTGTQVAITSEESSSFGSPAAKLLYISVAFGGGLAINASIFASLSGAMFNPAVTLALLFVRTIKPLRALHATLTQLVAGICAAYVADALLPGKLLTATTLVPAMSVSRGLFLEMFLTAQLVLTVLMVPNGTGKPLVVGLTLFVCEICGVYWTGGSLNPARSFGPAVVEGFVGYHWIYWVGPALGAGLGSAVFWGLGFVKKGMHEG